MKVLNYGSLNIDYVYQVDHIVKEGETISSKGMETFCGGKGLNQSLALARAGVSVWHAGMIGQDGQILLDACGESGVDTSLVQKTDDKNGHTIIQVDAHGQNCILLYGGSNQRQTKPYIDQVLANFAKGDLLVLQNEINLLDYVIDQAYQKGMRIVLNPSPYDAQVEKCDLSKVSIFFINEIEGGQITGETEPQKICDVMRRRFPDASVVLTLGEDGSVYQDASVTVKQDIFPTKVVDTTAAGDTFTGYFLASLLEGKAPAECLRRGAKAASIAVSRNGAVSSIPYSREVG